VLLKKKDDGIQPEQFRKSVGEWVEECTKTHCQRASERTRIGYRAVLERYLKPESHLWGTKLVALTPQDVQGWLWLVRECGAGVTDAICAQPGLI